MTLSPEALAEMERLLSTVPAGMRPDWEVHEDTTSGVYEIRTVLDGDVDGDTGRHLIVGGEPVAYMADALGEHDLATLIVAAVNGLPALLATARENAERAKTNHSDVGGSILPAEARSTGGAAPGDKSARPIYDERDREAVLIANRNLQAALSEAQAQIAALTQECEQSMQTIAEGRERAERGEADYANACDVGRRIEAERDALKASSRAHIDSVEQALTQRDAAEASLARAVEGLRPFGELAANIPGLANLRYDDVWGHVPVQAWRNAASILAASLLEGQ